MEKPYVVGIDIGGTNTVFGVVDARGTILYSGSIKTGKYVEIDDYVSFGKWFNVSYRPSRRYRND